MPSPLRIIRGSSAALYPFTQTYQFFTGIAGAQNGSTSRWVQAPPILSFDLPYEALNQTQKNNLKTDFTSAKGQFATDRSITTDQEYDALSFDEDEIAAAEKVTTQYGFRWRLTQTAAQDITSVTTIVNALTSSQTFAKPASLVGFPAATFDILIDSEQITVTAVDPFLGSPFSITRHSNGTSAAAHSAGTSIRLAPGNSFPALTNGAPGQLAFVQKKRFQTAVARSPFGPKFTYAEFAGGLTNFPTDGLMGWEWHETALSDADLAIRVNHFIAQWGDCFSFPFTDEDGTTYTKCYYASPTLAVTRSGPNQNAVTTSIIQTF